MNTIFMNSKNSKKSDPKINLKRSDKYLALSNISKHYTWKNIKKSCETMTIRAYVIQIQNRFCV